MRFDGMMFVDMTGLSEQDLRQPNLEQAQTYTSKVMSHDPMVLRSA
jgi:hypothetical protein